MRTALIALAFVLFASLKVAAQDTLNADWKRMDDFPWLSSHLDAVMVDSLRAYVVGGSSFDKVAGWIVRTRDGGATWELTERKRRESYEKISAFDPNRLLVLSVEHFHGQVWRPPIWRIRKLEVGDTTGEPIWHYSSFLDLYGPIWHGCFPDGSAYVSVYYGTPADSGHAVIRTRDFGTTWDTAYKVPRQDFEPNWHWFEAISVPAPGIAHMFHLNREGTLSHIESSYDEGRSWRRTYEHRQSITFRLDTLDFGQWVRNSVFAPYANKNLIYIVNVRTNSMLRINLETGAAEEFKYQANGMLPRRVGGLPKFVPSFLYFSDMINGIAVNGVYGERLNLFFTTRDAGRTWERMNASCDLGTGGRGSVFMTDSEHGIALSTDCGVFMTRTGGGLIVSRSLQFDVHLYPNPAREEFSIELNLTQNGAVQVELLDLTGRSVALLYDQPLTAGSNVLNFSPNLPAGVYGCRITAGGRSTIEKLVWME